MTETKYYYLTSSIKQMNTTFNIVIATTDPTEIIQRLLDDAKHHIEIDLHEIDDEFSIEKKDSMVSKFQKGDQDPLINSEPFQLVYDQTIIAEQMTQHYYSAYFNGKYDPTGIIKSWAMEQVFDDYLRPLLEANADIEGVSFKSGEDVKLATRRNSDYRWSINISKPNTDENLTSYYLQNGSIATVNTSNFEKVPRSKISEMEQVTILSGNLTDSVVWANAGISSGTDIFPRMILRSDLTGMFIDKKLGIVNFRDGSLSTNKKIFLK